MDAFGLIGADGDTIALIAVGATATLPLAKPGRLGPLPLEPLGLLLAFLAGYRPHYPSSEAPVRARQVNVPRHVGQGDPVTIGERDEVLKLCGVTREPVLVDDDDSITRASLQLPQHAFVFWPRFSAVGAEVVVNVDLGDCPTQFPGEVAAELLLPLHAKSLTAAVLGDPAVERGGSWCAPLTGWIHARLLYEYLPFVSTNFTRSRRLTSLAPSRPGGRAS